MKYGLIGEKLGHSFSKEVHNKLFDYDYELKEIPQNELDLFLKQRAFKAINVTIPYKEKVIPYLDFISDIAKEFTLCSCFAFVAILHTTARDIPAERRSLSESAAVPSV